MNVNCPECGKLYKSRHFINHMIKKHGWLIEDAENYYIAPVPENLPDPDFVLVSCPECGTMIPDNLAGCWNCGAIISSQLIRLMAENR